jgi:hypothetical protein
MQVLNQDGMEYPLDYVYLELERGGARCALRCPHSSHTVPERVQEERTRSETG